MHDLKLTIKNFLHTANSRTLLNIGLLVFILLLVLLVIMEPGKEDQNKTVFLTELKQGKIDEIELIRPAQGNISLRKKEDIWYLTTPYQLPANDFRAQSVSTLAEQKSHLQYDASKVELKKFKLDKPEVTIVLNKDIKLEIGGVDPINNRRYVKNGNTLHLVTDNFYYQIIGQVTAYISYQIIPPETELTRLVLPKFNLSLEEGDWKLSPAQKEEVSADSIHEFIDEWRHAQSLEISEYQGRARKTDIQVFYKNQVQPIEFSIYKKDESTYLLRKDLKLSYKLSDETAEKLQKLPPPPEPKTPATDASKTPPEKTGK